MYLLAKSFLTSMASSLPVTDVQINEPESRSYCTKSLDFTGFYLLSAHLLGLAPTNRDSR